MKISQEWLAEFVDLPDTKELVSLLATAGIEVDEVLDPASKISGVVVAEVKSCEPHPKADRLKVCQVFDGQDTHTVVCGAANVDAGQRVPLARVGANLGGFEITARKLRGVESQGMICSQEELQLADKSEGIWELPDTFTLGTDIFEAAEVSPTLELGLTPNRPDLLSHVGVAREVAAATGQRVKAPTWRVAEKGPDVGTLARIVVDDPKACKRYVGRVVRNVKIGPSPDWLKKRLESVGQRSINNVVDVTNFVLMEMGQPLHAFDLARLGAESGVPTIHVRFAKDDEKLTTLDDVERELGAEDLVIADATKPVALAGVMGGANSEVSDTTSDILVESAWFDPVCVRRTAKRHRMHTEASHRFERGADPGITAKAADRCAQLIAEVGGGEVAKGVIDVLQKDLLAPREISLRLERLPRVLGIDATVESVVQLLEPLEIRCTRNNKDVLAFQAPTFRPDLEREVDLIEEVARRHGYDNIPETLPDGGGAFVHEPVVRLVRDAARAALLRAGCDEAINFGFGSPSHAGGLVEGDAPYVKIVNPLGEEFSAMRTSLMPGLLGALAHNQRRGSKYVRVFEVGQTFHPRSPAAEDDERDRDLPREDERVGIVIYGERHDSRWYAKEDPIDFSDLAGVIEALESGFPNISIRREAAEVPGLNPHAAAKLWVDDTELGFAGQLHPDVADRFGVEGPVYVAEVSLDVFAAQPTVVRKYVAAGKFPGTHRDVAVVVDRSVPSETIREFIEANAGGKLGKDVVERVRLFDVYDGKGIPKGKVSLAFAIDYRSAERTLTDDEVGKAFDGVLAKLQKKFDAELRS